MALPAPGPAFVVPEVPGLALRNAVSTSTALVAMTRAATKLLGGKCLHAPIKKNIIFLYIKGSTAFAGIFLYTSYVINFCFINGECK